MKRVNSNDNDNSNLNILRDNFRETETAALFRINSSRKDVNSFMNVQTSESKDIFNSLIKMDKNIKNDVFKDKQTVDTQENEVKYSSSHAMRLKHS